MLIFVAKTVFNKPDFLLSGFGTVFNLFFAYLTTASGYDFCGVQLYGTFVVVNFACNYMPSLAKKNNSKIKKT